MKAPARPKAAINFTLSGSKPEKRSAASCDTGTIYTDKKRQNVSNTINGRIVLSCLFK